MKRLAFSTLACPEWSFEEAVAAASRFGYEGIEIRLLDGEVLPPRLPASQLRRVGDAVASAALEVVCVDTSLRVGKRSTDLKEQGEAYLAMAAAWGSPCIRVFGGDPAVGLGRDGVEIASEQLSSLVPAARSLGVSVLVETHDVFAATEPLAEVLESIGSERVGALWDLLHPWRVGEEPAQTLSRLRPFLELVHIKDGVRLTGGKAELRMLGEGEVPTREILGMLDEAGYDGWLCVEWERKWHPHLAPAEEALATHAKRLRDLLTG